MANSFFTSFYDFKELYSSPQFSEYSDFFVKWGKVIIILF